MMSTFAHLASTINFPLGLEARLTNSDIQIWPQRLVGPKTDPNDDTYEAYVMIGLRCSEADRPLADVVAGRWQTQILEDTLYKDECFMVRTRKQSIS